MTDEEFKYRNTLRALKGLWHHIETGALVRNTDGDKNSDWAIKAMDLVLALKEAQEIVEKHGNDV